MLDKNVFKFIPGITPYPYTKVWKETSCISGFVWYIVHHALSNDQKPGNMTTHSTIWLVDSTSRLIHGPYKKCDATCPPTISFPLIYLYTFIYVWVYNIHDSTGMGYFTLSVSCFSPFVFPLVFNPCSIWRFFVVRSIVFLSSLRVHTSMFIVSAVFSNLTILSNHLCFLLP